MKKKFSLKYTKHFHTKRKKKFFFKFLLLLQTGVQIFSENLRELQKFSVCLSLNKNRNRKR